KRAAFDRQIGFIAFLIDIIQIGIGDDLKAPGNQRVMNLPLPVQLLFIVIFLRQARLHLFKSLIVHLGGVDVTAHDFGAEGLGEKDPDIYSSVGMVGIVDRYVDRLIHWDASSRRSRGWRPLRDSS